MGTPLSWLNRFTCSKVADWKKLRLPLPFSSSSNRDLSSRFGLNADMRFAEKVLLFCSGGLSSMLGKCCDDRRIIGSRNLGWTCVSTLTVALSLAGRLSLMTSPGNY